MIALKPNGGHWYLRDGTPFYETIGKNGNPRKVTITDAMKVNALPSVTNILGCIAKPGLDNWRIKQALLAAETLPRIEGESSDDRQCRVVADMDAESERAKALGTAIHDAIAEYASKGTVSLSADLLPLFAPVREWMDENITGVYWSEKIMVNTAEGYAGRGDMLCEMKDIGLALPDFKTQKIKKKPVFYDEWPLQLAAYERCIPEHAALVSVVINTVEPSAPSVKVWDDGLAAITYYDTFLNICAAWRYFHDYDPRDSALPETENETNNEERLVNECS